MRYNIEHYDLLTTEEDRRRYVLEVISELTSNVSSFISSPEVALIDSQIMIIQNRSYGMELSLEDVKKLDLLLKNKQLLSIKSPKDLIPDYKRLNSSKLELLELAKK